MNQEPDETSGEEMDKTEDLELAQHQAILDNAGMLFIY